MVNMQNVINRINAVQVKKFVGEFLGDMTMLNEVENEKARIIYEVVFNDPVIRSRFNHLFGQH